MVWNYQNADCSLRKKIIVLAYLLQFSAHFRSFVSHCFTDKMWISADESLITNERLFTSVFSIISILSTASPSDLNLIYPHCNAFAASLLPAEQAITLSRWNQANGEQFNIVCQRWFQFLYKFYSLHCTHSCILCTTVSGFIFFFCFSASSLENKRVHRTLPRLLSPRKRGIMFLPALVCLSVCLFVTTITK